MCAIGWTDVHACMHVRAHTHTHTHTSTFYLYPHPHSSLVIVPPPTSDANLDDLSEDGRLAIYSCDSALYELEGSCSIVYDDENGWPDAPACKGIKE